MELTPESTPESSPNPVKRVAFQLARFYPNILYVACALFLVIHPMPFGATTLVLLLSTQFFIKLLKHIFGGSKPFTKRPGSPEWSCGGDIRKNSKNSSGFPSGHALTSMFFAIWVGFYVYNTRTDFWRYVAGIILISVALLVCYTRNKIKCHTVNQLIGGSGFAILYVGSLLLLAYYLKEKEVGGNDILPYYEDIVPSTLLIPIIMASVGLGIFLFSLVRGHFFTKPTKSA